jgi:ceramide glucosyltransferase
VFGKGLGLILNAVFEWGGLAVLAMAASGAVYACIAAWATWRFRRQRPARASGRPAVCVLRPLHGDEPELYENLASLCRQDYAGPLRIVLGASDPADPALAYAARLQREHPELDIVLVADPTTHGGNRKLGNLINMSAQATGEIVVISDSDVRLPKGGVDAIVAALEAEGVGLVYCLYRGRPTRSFWSKLAAMDVNTRFAPSVLVGQALGAAPVLGPTMALRADLLREVGGFQRLADVLADDFELGRAVRAAGRTIACPPMIIDHVFPERTAAQMLTHELRWARTIRLVEPAGYLGSVVIHFLPLALIGAALIGFSRSGFSGWSLGLLGGFTLLRLAQAAVFSRLMGADRVRLWLVPLRDVVSFGVFLAAIAGDRVVWRGARFKVGRDGVIAAA